MWHEPILKEEEKLLVELIIEKKVLNDRAGFVEKKCSW